MKIHFWLTGLLFTMWACTEADQHRADHQPTDIDKRADQSSTVQVVVTSDGSFELNSNAVFYAGLSAANQASFVSVRKKQLVNAQNPGASGNASYLVSGFNMTGGKETKVWQHVFSGDQVEVSKQIVQLSSMPEDGGENTLSYFNAFNGESLLSFTHSGIDILIPNSDKRRYAGFLARSAVGDSKKRFTDPNTLGFLQFASETQALSELRLAVTDKSALQFIDQYTPDMTVDVGASEHKLMNEGKGMILWGLEEDFSAEDISGFSIHLNFYVGENYTLSKITIPVVNDQYDLVNASFDKNVFKLERL